MSEPNLFGVKPKEKKAKAIPAPDHSMHTLIAFWTRIYESRFGEKPAITGRDAKALKHALVTLAGGSVVVVEKRLRLYLEIDDAYVINSGNPLVLFPNYWNRLAAQERQAQGSSRVPNADQTDDYLRSLRRR